MLGWALSDVHLTEHCGVLKKLLPGDVVLADHGFDIADSVGAMQAKLHIPAFTRNKSQLSALEVEEARKIANVRIHVELLSRNSRFYKVPFQFSMSLSRMIGILHLLTILYVYVVN